MVGDQLKRVAPLATGHDLALRVELGLAYLHVAILGN